VAKQAASYLQRPLEETNLIVLHLGNGASAAAIEAGRSVDTSMGMTPLEGLMMGTRCGDLDPAVVFYLAQVTGQSNEQVESLLNKQSGLKGICGTNDMRGVLRLAAAGDEQARLAISMYAYRVRKYIGAYCSVLSRVDAIVFTAGIGENSPEIRARSCHGLSNLGILIDPEKNATPSEGTFEIQAERSDVKVLVVPTDEELEIAEETVDRIRSTAARSRRS
jgi:acetate kinase